MMGWLPSRRVTVRYLIASEVLLFVFMGAACSSNPSSSGTTMPCASPKGCIALISSASQSPASIRLPEAAGLAFRQGEFYSATLSYPWVLRVTFNDAVLHLNELLVVHPSTGSMDCGRTSIQVPINLSSLQGCYSVTVSEVTLIVPVGDLGYSLALARPATLPIGDVGTSPLRDRLVGIMSSLVTST
jgi:hypothetical protein